MATKIQWQLVVFPKKASEDWYYADISIDNVPVGHVLLDRAEMSRFRDDLGAEVIYPKGQVRLEAEDGG